MGNFHIKQLFDSLSSTYTYLLFDSKSKEAVIIDPVLDKYERDSTLIKQLDLKLEYVLETHIHADHITSAFKFKEGFSSKIAVSENAKASCVDIKLVDGQEIKFGSLTLKAISTPGHTNTCTSFYYEGLIFTGDTLLIRGCGRTDFQEGSAVNLYESVRNKIFTYPDDTTVYPAHDYNGFTSSTVGEEKLYNSRLSLDKTKEEFIEIMDNLNLDHPKKIKEAVPANLKCGNI